MLCHLTAALSLALSIYFFIFIFYFFFCLMSLWVLRCWRQGSRSPIPLPCHHQGRPGRLRRWRAGFLQRTSCCSSGLLVLDAVEMNISPTWQAWSSRKGLGPNGVLVASPGSGAAAGLHTASNKSQQPFAAISKKLSCRMRLKNCYSSLHPLCTFILQKFI